MTEFKGDISELMVFLHTKISHDVWMFVGLAKQGYLIGEFDRLA